MDFQNTMIFVGIPILTVAVIFVAKRNILWAAPLISSATAFFCYMIALAPITMAKVFANSEWRAFYLWVMLMQFAITVILMAIAYLAAYVIKRKKK